MGDFRDPAVAANWHASQLTHRARGRQLDLLIDLLVALGPARVLDIGVGSGLVADRILDRLPEVSLVGVDFSAVMLAQARTRLARWEGRVDLVEGDVSRPEAIGLPKGGAFHAAITPSRRCTTSATRDSGEPSPGLTVSSHGALSSYPSTRRPSAGRSTTCTRLGPSSTLGDFPESFEEYEERETRAGEHSPPLEAYLEWLREAGFEAGVLDLEANYALVAGRATA